MDTIYKYRAHILTSLVLINLILATLLPFSKLTHNHGYWITETLFNLLLAFFAFYLLRKESSINNKYIRDEFIHNLSPYGFAYYNRTSGVLTVNKTARTLLGLVHKSKYSISDIQHLFTDSDWQDIKPLLSPNTSGHTGYHIDSVEKSGTIKLHSFDTTDAQFLRYQINPIFYKKLGLNGFIIWFTDSSETAKIESEIITLIKKYRLISFENDLILNTLPIPIWKRDENLEITFLNEEAIQLYKNKTTLYEKDDFEEFLKSLAKESLHAGAIQKRKKTLETINNTVMHYEFYEVPLGEIHGTIGFALNIENQEKTVQSLKTFKEAFKKMLEISNRPILILNFTQHISYYNKNLLDLFDLDEEWLSHNPSFSNLIDRLNETGKMPEVQNYKNFKQKLLKTVRELTSPHNELMHLPNNQTLNYHFLPLKDGSVIIAIDNISHSLNFERTLNEQIIVQSKILSYISEPLFVIAQNARLKLFNEALVSNYNLDLNLISSFPRFEEVLEAMIPNNNKLSTKLKTIISNALETRKEGEIIDATTIWQVKNLPDSSIIILIKKNI